MSFTSSRQAPIPVMAIEVHILTVPGAAPADAALPDDVDRVGS